MIDRGTSAPNHGMRAPSPGACPRAVPAADRTARNAGRRFMGPVRLLLVVAPLLALAAARPAPSKVPALVFVSRAAAEGTPGAIPGLGPRHRALATGGRLLVRDARGRIAHVEE